MFRAHCYAHARVRPACASAVVLCARTRRCSGCPDVPPCVEEEGPLPVLAVGGCGGQQWSGEGRVWVWEEERRGEGASESGWRARRYQRAIALHSLQLGRQQSPHHAGSLVLACGGARCGWSPHGGAQACRV